MEMHERIQLRMAELGLKAVNIASRTGMTKGTVSQWVNGYTKPRGENLDKLASVLKCSPEWLVFGAESSSNLGTTGPAPEYVGVPLYDADIAAGNGGFVESDRVTETVPVSADYLFKKGVPRESAIIFKIRGDSMEPTLFNGDVALGNKADIKPVSGKIYAFDLEGDLRVKRFIKRIDSAWTISSDNKDDPNYQDETISASHVQNLRIIAKVISILERDLS